MKCPNDNLVAEFTQATVSKEVRVQTALHLDKCESCRVLFAALAQNDSFYNEALSFETASTGKNSIELAPEEITIGSKVNDYQIIRPLGAGGMGFVWLAQSHSLDRLAAIKVLHNQNDGNGKTLIKEAKAIAQLSHSNVVTIYGFGTWGAQDYVAMEYVEGAHLAEYLEKSTSDINAIVELMIAAGRGIAAAHAKALVHCDIKPSNILIGTAGNVKITDFGLAHWNGLTVQTVSDSGNVLQTRMYAGTPAYMAPEQHQGKIADERSDQYSFCATLYEALLGQRPLPGNTIKEIRLALALAKRNKGLAPKGLHKTLPRKIGIVLGRGLSYQPEDRYPDMATLLDALSQSIATRTSRFYMLAALAIALLVAMGVGLLVTHDIESDIERVRSQVKGDMEAVWNSTQRIQLRNKIEGQTVFSPVFRTQVADRTIAHIDKYQERWQQEHIRAWQRQKEGTRSKKHHLAQVQCLERLKKELSGFIIVVLSSKTKTPIDQVVVAAQYLRHPVTCDNLAQANLDAKQDIVMNAEVLLELEKEVAKLRALFYVGSYLQAETLAQELTSKSITINAPTIMAETHLWLGRIQLKLLQKSKAQDTLRKAVQWAAEAQNDRIIAEVWIALVLTSIESEQGAAWADAAQASTKKLGEDFQIQGALAAALGALHYGHAEYKKSFEALQEAIAFRESQPGLELQAAFSHADLSRTLISLEQLDDATSHAEHSLQQLTALLGTNHPMVAVAHRNRAIAYSKQGDLDRAKSNFESCLTINRGVYGRLHTQIVVDLGNLGNVLQMQGETEHAIQIFSQALALANKLPSSQEARSDSIHNNLGVVLYRQNRLIEAEQHILIALELRIKRFGKIHNRVADSRGNLADIYTEQKKYGKALEQDLLALEVYKETVGPQNSSYALTVASIANVYFKQGNLNEALKRYEESRTLLQDAKGPNDFLAYAELGLAEVLWELGQKAKARQMAKSAKTLYQTVPNAKNDVADAEAWIRKHR